MSKNINGGNIQFKTTLDSSNLKAQLSVLKKQINNIEKNPIKLNVDTKNTTKKVDDVNKQIKKIDNSKVKINADTSNAKKQLDQLVNNSNTSLKVKFTEIALDLGEKIGNALSGVFDKYFPSLYSDAKRYKQDLSNIEKLGYSKEDLNFLDDYFKDISNKIGINREEVSNAGITAAQANIDLKSNTGKQMMETALMISKNSQESTGNKVDTAEVIKLLTRIEAVYSGRYSSQDIADKFLKATDMGIIDMNEIIQYGGRTFKTAGALDIGIEQILGLASVSSKSGEVPLGFTEIDAMLNEMRKGRDIKDSSVNQTYMTSDEKKDLKNKGFKNGREIKAMLQSGDLFAALDMMDKLPGELSDTFSNMKSIAGSDIWKEQRQDVLDYTEEIKNSNGELEKQIEIQNSNDFQNLDDAMNKINNSVKSAFEDSLIPILNKFADVLDVIPTEVLGSLAVGVMGLGAVSKILTPLASLTIVFGNLSKTMGLLTGAGGLGGIVTLLSNPVFLVVGSAIFLLTSLFLNWDKVVGALKTTLEFLGNIIKGIVTFVWDLITGIGELIVKLVELSFKMSPLGLLSQGIGLIGNKINGTSSNMTSTNSVNTTQTYNVNNYVTMSSNGDMDTFNRKLLSELNTI